MSRNLFKTALVLSGGSARALTHLGVLEEIEKHDIKVDMIVGASMGAVIGSLYAYYGEVGPVIEKMKKLVDNDLFLRTISVATEDVPELGPDGFFTRFVWLFRKGVYYTHSMIRPTLVPEEDYLEIMYELLPDHAIEDLPIPFAAVAMDLMNGEEIVLRRGSLRKAVTASAAIPGILPSIRHHGRILVDGGWVDNVPVAPAIAMGAHFVIAVDATLDVLGLGPPPNSAIESLFRCNEISRIALNRHRKTHADILLVPELGPLHWADFSGMKSCIEAGRAVIESNLTKILRARKLRKYVTLSGSLHPARRTHWKHPFFFY
jgi:NTE family protein